MIANKLRQFFTSCWLAIASPAQNGSTYTQKMLPVCYGGSIAGLLQTADREAMKEALTNKYGIREID
ncbi:hypothetical protein NKG95_28985 [Mesorhizobium sp. M1423]